MNTAQKLLITQTVPILKTNGNDLVTYFYKRMFEHNPELKNIFNMVNQANGKQQNALTGAVLAYAEHIENPSVLVNTLKTIGQKHISLNIKPEQYPIVGHHLLASIKEVLGDKVATPELMDAWACAYQELADIMISIESRMYQTNRDKKGGWKGWRTFVISKIVSESEEIKSFYLKAEDGKEISSFLPGQYLTIKTFVPDLGYEQPRQYSISSDSNQDYYRISIKKEKGIGANPDGFVSAVLHEKKEGDILEVTVPAGEFYVNPESSTPLVLISGGVGLTPLMAMIEANTIALEKKKIVWVHGCRNEAVHAFKDRIENLTNDENWLSSYVFHEKIAKDNSKILEGWVDLNAIKKEILIEEANYYICGPAVFIKKQFDSLIELGIEKDSIHYEEFGPQILNLN